MIKSDEMKRTFLFLAVVPILANSQTVMMSGISDNWQTGNVKPFDKKLRNSIIYQQLKPARQENRKSAYLTKYLLDSICQYSFNSNLDSLLTDKQQYQYDANGNDTATFSYYIQQYPYNILLYKNNIFYDGNGNDTLQINYDWDKTNNQWIPSTKKEMHHNIKGFDSASYSYNWNQASNEWIRADKGVYSYDKYGLFEFGFSYNWNPYNKSWVGTYGQRYAHDANGQDTLYITYEWDSKVNEWIIMKKIRFEIYYNENNHDTMSLVYEWNETKKIWNYSVKTEQSWDSKENPLMSAYYCWNNISMEWEGVYKMETKNSSDPAREDSLSIFYFYWYDLSGKQWFYDFKIETLFFDKSRYDRSWICFNWDTTAKQWLRTDYKEIDFYFTNGNRKAQYYFDWDTAINDWKLSGRTYYYYTILNINNINPIHPETIKIWPNPANKLLNIDIGNNSSCYGNLYASNGQMIKNLKINRRNNLYDISNLKTGIYLLQIPTLKGMISRKFVKN
jgi:hypothetical protein